MRAGQRDALYPWSKLTETNQLATTELVADENMSLTQTMAAHCTGSPLKSFFLTSPEITPRQGFKPMKTAPLEEWQSGQKTAKKVCEILVSLKSGFVVPTARQKANLLVAFAKRGKA